MGGRVLVTDDDAALRGLLQMALESVGHEVVTAEDGRQGVFAAMNQQFDLILLDIEMPNMSGLEALEQLRGHPKTRSIPVIMLTGVSTKENVLRALKSQVKDFITKADFDVKVFLGRVAEHLPLTPKGGGSKPAAERPAAKQPVESDEPAAPAAKPAPAEAERPALASGPAAADGSMPETGRESVPAGKIKAALRKAREVKAIPAVAVRILELTRDEDASAPQIVEELQKEQAVAGRVLRLANSAYYAARGSVSTLDRAVLNIGQKEIGDIVAGLALVEQFLKPSEEGGLDRLALWMHSFCCAAYARRIADNAELAGGEHLFLAGVLQSIGAAFFDDFLHDDYLRAFERARETGRPIADCEREIMGIDHRKATVALLERWGIDESIIEPIRSRTLSRERAEGLADAERARAVALGVAEALAVAHGVPSGLEEGLASVSDEDANMLRLGQATVAEMGREVEKDLRDLWTIFFAHDPETAEAVTAGRGRPGEGRQVTLVCPERPLVDSLELWLGAMGFEAETSEDLGGEPGGAVLIELVAGSYLEQIAADFDAIADADVGPIVVAAKPGVDAGALASRGATVLSEPFHPDVLLAALGVSV